MILCSKEQFYFEAGIWQRGTESADPTQPTTLCKVLTQIALKQFSPKGNTLTKQLSLVLTDPGKPGEYHHFILPRKHLPQINDPLLQIKCLL